MICSDIRAISPTPALTLDRDVIGLDEHVLTRIKTYIEIFKDPKRFSELGAKLPKGLLFVGPAGTGKTLLARAMAGEIKMAFFNAPATSFLGALDIKKGFERARKLRPCILFIDEIDTIGAINRGQQSSDPVSNNRRAMLNELLVELSKENTQVMIIAATNYPNILDGALIRSGRFDDVIEIPKPGFNGRVKLLLHYIFKLPKLDLKTITGEALEELARQTNGFTASDFENIVNQAALCACRERKQIVDATDIIQGFEIVAKNKIAVSQSY